jgi:hypothetical protein
MSGVGDAVGLRSAGFPDIISPDLLMNNDANASREPVSEADDTFLQHSPATKKLPFINQGEGVLACFLSAFS